MQAAIDTTLLLRVHAEHEWLQGELLALLDQLEDAASLQGNELQAALAYLEVTWGEELRRAEQTDAAYERLQRACARDATASALGTQARGYYRWLRNFRHALAVRVEPYVGGGALAGLSM